MAKQYEIIPSEDSECEALMQWCNLHSICRDYLTHIPNGGIRNKVVAAKLKRQGVRPGYPDFLLSFPCNEYPGLYIEMKRRKGGALSKAQKHVIANLRAVGYKVVVTKGWEIAVEEIQIYLGEL